MSYTCNWDGAIKPARPMKPWNKRLIGEFEYEVWHFHINDCWTVCRCAIKRCALAISYYFIQSQLRTKSIQYEYWTVLGWYYATIDVCKETQFHALVCRLLQQFCNTSTIHLTGTWTFAGDAFLCSLSLLIFLQSLLSTLSQKIQNRTHTCSAEMCVYVHDWSIWYYYLRALSGEPNKAKSFSAKTCCNGYRTLKFFHLCMEYTVCEMSGLHQQWRQNASWSNVICPCFIDNSIKFKLKTIKHVHQCLVNTVYMHQFQAIFTISS